jgi:hypothetical protein
MAGASFLKEEQSKMLTPNIPHHAMLKLRAAVLFNHIIRIAEFPCPACGTIVGANDPEDDGNGGWRLICSGCHQDILISEKRRP